MKKLIVLLFCLISLTLSSQWVTMYKYTIDRDGKVTQKECYSAHIDSTKGIVQIRSTKKSILFLHKISDKYYKDDDNKVWWFYVRDGIAYFQFNEKLAYFYSLK